MRNKDRLFTEQEDDFIRANYQQMPSGAVAAHLNRPIQSVRNRAVKLGVTRRLKRWTEEEDQLLIQTWKARGRMDKLAERLGRRACEVCSRAKKLGCYPWRQKPPRAGGRLVDGFVNGKPIWTHRRIIEDELGRPLTSEEIVHHIDGDKDNNERSNLCLLKDRAAHFMAHYSYSTLLSELVHRGYIRFNTDAGVYEICEMDK